jgi:CRISPR/Cas system-associated endonuclease Cas1
MLNYAYAILESQMRIQLVSEGYDPTLGIMHESHEGSSAFVFDMMEPERPKVDRCIMEFVCVPLSRNECFCLRYCHAFNFSTSSERL